MDELLKKLNYKPPAPVTILAPPDEFAPVLERWSGEVAVRRRLGKNEAFVLGFVRSRSEIAERAAKAAAGLADDGVLWMAYPKKSSKRYTSDVGRDDGWQPLGDLGFEAVRQIALDDDWSALRFRPAANIATMTRARSGALSAEGKRKVDDKVVAEFLASLPEDRRPVVERVHDVIRKAAPELEPGMFAGMLGYGQYHYRYASGREGDSYVVGLANRKQYVSLYLCGVEDDRYLAEANAERLGNVSVGKSCVRFKRLEDLDLDVVAELVRATADQLAPSA